MKIVPILLAILIITVTEASSATDCKSLFFATKLPAHIEAITNTFPETSGPNCHNAVAYWHRLVNEFRPVTGHELDLWLSDTTKFLKLHPAESLSFGDVVVFRLGPLDPILHSSIYLSPGRFWQKEGDWKEAGWQVTASSVVYQEYEGLTIERYRKQPLSAAASKR